MKKLFLIVAAATLMLVGCKKQTELNFSDMGKATVLVNVNYNPGEHNVNGVIVNGNLPYADAEVFARIDYSQYSDDAVGIKEVAAENKGNGKYEVKVPAGQKPINLEIVVRGFTADYYETSNFTVEAFYTADPVGVGGLIKDDVKSVNINMYKESSANSVAANKELRVYGTTKLPTESLIYVDETLIGNNLIAENNIDRLDVEYVGNGCQFELTIHNFNDSRTLKYTFNSNNAGAFNETVKYYDSWEINDIYVTIKPIAFVGPFVHRYFEYNETEMRYLASSQILNGYYSNESGVTHYATIGDQLLGMNIGDVELYYTAEDESIIRGAYDTGAVINGFNQYKTIWGGLWY